MQHIRQLLLLQAKFHGTTVTREAFLEWRKKFEEEMNEQLGNKDNAVVQSTRLTGIRMFSINTQHSSLCGAVAWAAMHCVFGEQFCHLTVNDELAVHMYLTCRTSNV